MDREKVIAEFDRKFFIIPQGAFIDEIKKFLLSKIAEAEKHMAEIAIEQINAIEGDLMEEEHESLSNLCKYAREEIMDELEEL